MKAMKDYHNLYLKHDVLLLANIFEKIINDFLNNYESSSSHYFSSPTLNCDGMLNKTKIELELISDPDMYIFFEKGRRGVVRPAVSISNLMT